MISGPSFRLAEETKGKAEPPRDETLNHGYHPLSKESQKTLRSDIPETNITPPTVQNCSDEIPKHR